MIATSSTEVAWRERALPYFGFAAGGVGFALPGALMPWLLAHWSLRDNQAGLFLFLFSAGTMSGALFARGNLLRWIAAGAACSSVGAILLAHTSRGSLVAARSAMLLYGFGLGIMLTSISLLQSRRWAEECAAEMTRLNLLWAIGACTAPWLVMHGGLRNGISEDHILTALAATFLAFGVAMLLLYKPSAEMESQQQMPKSSLLATPLALLLMIFCATGVESACGGWLAAYAQRSGHSLGVTIAAPTCLWAGLLLSRALYSSARVGRANQNFLLTWNIAIMAAAVACLIVFQGGVAILLAAFVLGFASGPIYPLLLALVFEHHHSNLIFVLAGVGSASFPLLTGALSTAVGSLRLALLVPFTGAMLMAIAGWSARRNLINGLRPL
jgi:hypothetical protein